MIILFLFPHYTWSFDPFLIYYINNDYCHWQLSNLANCQQINLAKYPFVHFNIMSILSSVITIMNDITNNDRSVGQQHNLNKSKKALGLTEVVLHDLKVLYSLRQLNLQYLLPVVKDRTSADKHRVSIQVAGLGDGGGRDGFQR